MSRENKDKPSSLCKRFMSSNAAFIIVIIQILILCRSNKCVFDTVLEEKDFSFPLQLSNEYERNESSSGLLSSDGSASSIADNTRRKSRVLMGLLAATSPDLNDYARVQRRLFDLHPNVCSLQQFQVTGSSACQLLYTFVLGANEDGPTEIVNDTMPVLANISVPILDGDDVIHLNIRENMNEGKSQTWFYYASSIADDLGIDYVGKIDLDTMLYLDKFFGFKEMHLPPAPYNNHILVGQLVDKDMWNINLYGKRFPGMFWPKEKLVLDHLQPPYHMYAQGGCYIMSTDLVKGLVRVANTVPKENYFEQHEDHDVSTLAFISTVMKEDPNYAATMSLKQMTTLSLFWKHPLKRDHIRWNRIWNNEFRRMGKIVKDVASKAS